MPLPYRIMQQKIGLATPSSSRLGGGTLQMRECMGNNKTINATGRTSATSASESASASPPGAAAAADVTEGVAGWSKVA